MFADEIATFTSITAGIHSQYFFLYDKIGQIEAGNSDAIIWKVSSVKFVFDSAKVSRRSYDPLIELATSFSSPIFRTHLHGYNFFIKFYPYGIGPATGKCASILFTLIPGDFDNLLQQPLSNSRNSSTLVSVINFTHWTHGRKQLNLIKTRLTRNPKSQQKKELRKWSLTNLFLTPISLAKLKVF